MSTTFDVALEADGDIGEITRHISGADLVLQSVSIRLQTFLGEIITDTSKGLDIIGFLSQKPPQTQAFGAQIRAEIETTDGVARVENFTATFDRSTQQATFGGDVILDEGVQATVTVLVGTAEASGNISAAITLVTSAGRILGASFP